MFKLFPFFFQIELLNPSRVPTPMFVSEKHWNKLAHMDMLTADFACFNIKGITTCWIAFILPETVANLTNPGKGGTGIPAIGILCSAQKNLFKHLGSPCKANLMTVLNFILYSIWSNYKCDDSLAMSLTNACIRGITNVNGHV